MSDRPARNEPCPCGSGLKQKKCCRPTSTGMPARFEERHQILKWSDAMCRCQRKQQPGPDGLNGFGPNAGRRAYLLLACNLYTLRPHSALQSAVVKRLKHRDQFQDAGLPILTFSGPTSPCRRVMFYLAPNLAPKSKVIPRSTEQQRPRCPSSARIHRTMGSLRESN